MAAAAAWQLPWVGWRQISRSELDHFLSEMSLCTTPETGFWVESSMVRKAVAASRKQLPVPWRPGSNCPPPQQHGSLPQILQVVQPGIKCCASIT